MAKSRTKADISRGQAAAKASAATKKTASSKSSNESQTPTQPKAQARSAAATPVSSDIRQAYKKSLLGKYLDTHRGQPAIKPKK
ncbi:MAG TPA: hypothetical protein VKA70_10820 [Blastocatellia bacterium]|nr:hypothetical protein [Blastocatellia bacterium]